MRIFVSAVTSEFGEARDQVAADLRARGHSVTVESDFHQSADSDTLLGTLHDYIRDCHAVICIMGKRSGACPPPAAAERFAHMLPAGITEASFTQWEFFFARHFRRRPYAYVANDDHKPDKGALTGRDRPELQTAFVQYLMDQGIHRTPFSNIDQLARAVLKDEPKIAAEPSPVPPSPAKPIVLPYPSLGSLFKGRDEFLRRLRESLVRGGQTAIVSQALYGLGGIGKTRAAVEYAWANADKYNALLFVLAETPEKLRSNLAALTSALVPNLETTDDNARLKATLDWIKTNPGWFLILDNVDTQDAMAAVDDLIRQLIGGHVVVTSRLSKFKADIDPLELDVLTVDDAVAFLLDRTKGRRRTTADDKAKAREVAVELGRLALALEQAAAFVAQRRTFDDYLKNWRENRDEVLKWFDETVTGYKSAVAVTWQTSVAQLSEGGRRLLERLAWLAPEKVPEFLLDVPIPGAEAENLHDALDDLAAYSLVTRDAEGPFFLVHRLVQDVTRRSLSGDAKHRSLVEALGWIDAAFTGEPDDVRNWPMLDSLAPHARIVAQNADSFGIPEPTVRLMNEVGVLLRSKALYVEAEPLYRRALAIHEISFGVNDPKVAASLTNLARLLYDTNRLAEAEPLMRRARAIVESSFGPDHPQIAIRLSNLAQLLKKTNRYAEAELLMRRALAIDETSLGLDHPNVAIRLNNLAQLLQDTNRLAEAEPLMRRVVSIFEKCFGADHPNVATALNNLALLLQNTNRLPETEPLMRRVVSIFEKSLGSNHPNVATALNNLATLLQATNRLAKAEPLMRRALAIDEKTYGPNHPDVAIDLNNLAQLLHENNRLADAEPLMRRALAILCDFERNTAHQHPSYEMFSANYAGLLTVLGKSPAEIEAAVDALKQPLR